MASNVGIAQYTDDPHLPNRYDMFSVSQSNYDPKTGEFYPDSLSMDFNNITYSQPPYQFEPDDRFINNAYTLCYALYGDPAYDDILYNINNIMHPSLLSPGLTDFSSSISSPQITVTTTNETATLSWYPVPGATSYNIYYSTSPSVSIATGIIIQGVSNPYTIYGLITGTMYYFLVTAIPNNGIEAPAYGGNVNPQIVSALLRTTNTVYIPVRQDMINFYTRNLDSHVGHS